MCFSFRLIKAKQPHWPRDQTGWHHGDSRAQHNDQLPQPNPIIRSGAPTTPIPLVSTMTDFSLCNLYSDDMGWGGWWSEQVVKSIN